MANERGKDSPAGREHFALMMETRRTPEDPEAVKANRAWLVLLKQGVSFRAISQGSAASKAERMLKQELARCDIQAEELGQQKKGAGQKIEIAARLRAQTTMTWDWIAQRLAMGTAAHAANRVRAALPAESICDVRD